MCDTAVMRSETPTPARTSSHVFVTREGKILALQQAQGLRWWELPGGEVEHDEPPAAAAVRETLEETGLRIGQPELLRRWSYCNSHGLIVDCYAYVAETMSSAVRLSDEHDAYEWMTVQDYAARFCTDLFGGGVPWIAAFLAEMRQNCAIFAGWHRRKQTNL